MPQLKPQTPLAQNLAKDLDCLLDMAFSLRSIASGDIESWLSGTNDLLKPKNKHTNDVEYLGQPTEGLEKHYELRAPSGQTYRFLITPKEEQCVSNNTVIVRHSKTYPEGPNTPGEKTTSKDKSVLYLLPWVAALPINHVTYEATREFFANNNGFDVRLRQSG